MKEVPVRLDGDFFFAAKADFPVAFCASHVIYSLPTGAISLSKRSFTDVRSETPDGFSFSKQKNGGLQSLSLLFLRPAARDLHSQRKEVFFHA